MSSHHAKYMETIKAVSVYMEQFSFIYIFIIFHMIKIGTDISRSGHDVVLDLRIKEHENLAWVRT